MFKKLHFFEMRASLTHSRLVNLIDVTLACKDGNSKLVEVVTVLDVDDDKCCNVVEILFLLLM